VDALVGGASLDGTINVARVDAAGDDQMTISVSDNGGGILENIRRQIFAPVSTTKEIGSGTGPGLSVCAAIISRFGGEISVDNIGTAPASSSLCPVPSPEPHRDG